jgi:hypothetical protein
MPGRAAPRFCEMTIERHCHGGRKNPGRDSAIADQDVAKRPSSDFEKESVNDSIGKKRPLAERCRTLSRSVDF